MVTEFCLGDEKTMWMNMEMDHLLPFLELDKLSYVRHH
jgi:hypothetical protein